MLRQPTGPRLRWLRSLIFVVGTLTVVLYTLGAPLYFRDLTQGCLQRDCGYGLVVTPSTADIESLGLTVPGYVLLLTAIEAAHAWLFFGVAALVFWRAAGNRVALLGAVFLLTWGATHSNPLYALVVAVPFLRPFANLLAFLSSATLFAFFSVFPSGAFVPRAMRYLLAAWTVIVLAVEFSPPGLEISPNPWLLIAALLAFIGFFLSLVVAQVYRYRRVSTPTQRVQTKWVVYGLSVAMLAFLAMLTLGAFVTPQLEALALWGLTYHLGIFGSTLIIPLALLRAVFQSRLWSIDLIIRRTLIYTVLTAALVALYFVVVVILQAVLAALTGENRSTLVTVLSTLAIAALFSPLRAWFQRAVDRRFYRSRYSAGQTLAAFSASVRDDVELDGLAARLVQVVDETMQPEHVSLWLKPASNPGGVAENLNQQ